jgi:hypothetical protein
MLPNFYKLFEPIYFIIGIMSCLILFWQERHVNVLSFRYSFACLTLITPLVLILATDRLALAFTFTAVFGTLHRASLPAISKRT